jgi:hypothetical protein
MAARAAVQGLLEASLAPGGELRDLGFEAAYAGNSVDTPAENAFIIVRWEETPQAFGRTGKQRLTIWLHSRDRDYADIDTGLEVVKNLLESAVHLPGADGWTLTQADWRGDSQDLYDDGYETITRNSAFDVVSRYSAIQI